jgi:pSer/pThr/pTyr-binding forkhead associated (FHA) protein
MSAEGIDLHEVAGTVYYVSIEAYRVTRSATLDLYTPGAKIEFPVVERSLNTPADARGALTVGATDFRDDSLASYSSQGPTTDGRLKPDVCAPTGVSGATYGEEGFDGTSASAPHVAGAAALVWSAFGDHSRDDILTYLTAHSLDLGPPGPDNVYGHGRAQLSAAPALGTETAPPAPAELPIPSQQVETIVPTLAVLLTATPVPVSTVTGTPHPEKPIGQSPTDPSPSAAPFRLSTGALAAVGATAFCGGAAVLGGAGMLLIARERPRQHASGVAVGSPDARSSTVQIGCGILKGRGIDPIPLRRGAVGLGRAGGNDVVLSSPQVSRFHARIVCGEDGCIVEDLGSVNGTFVDGERVTHAVLKAGSRLRLGDVELIYDLTVEHRTDAWLEVGGRRHWVPATGISIGTTSDNDLRVSDELASRRHARVDREGDEFTITDLGSTNGTFVNRRRVRHEFLHDGDEIRIGLSQVRFRRPRRL